MSRSSHIYISYFWYTTSLCLCCHYLWDDFNSAICSLIFAAAKVFLTKCILEIYNYFKNCNYNVVSVLEMTATVAPRFNAPLYNRLYNEVLGPTNDILRPSNGKIYEKRTSIGRNLYIANTFCQSLCPSVYRRPLYYRRTTS